MNVCLRTKCLFKRRAQMESPDLRLADLGDFTTTLAVQMRQNGAHRRMYTFQCRNREFHLVVLGCSRFQAFTTYRTPLFKFRN